MAAFYSEHDPGAAEWLRELMAAGLIAQGVVDERSIADLTADDLRGYAQVHLFAGIGGWSHALRLAGWFDDRPVWTGSCPCQPFSSAGKRKGAADARHLWPDMFRLVRECRPVVIFGEQVEGALRHGWLDGVCADLEGEGYAVGSAVLGAHSAGAPHIRQRLYWVADAASGGEVPAQLGGQRDVTQQGGDAGRLADADGQEPGRGELRFGAADGSDSRDAGVEEHAAPGVALGDASGKRSQVGIGDGGVRRGEGRPPTGEAAQLSGDVGFWDAFDLIPCRDGKSRRVEPGSFPLAHGVPGRVGLLRGYGNAICPQTAATFIQAYRQVTNA